MTAPTLLVDVGGTLLVRDRPGPFTAAIQSLTELGVELSRERRLILARALFTGADRAASVDLAAEQLGLTTAERLTLGTALAAPPGQATLMTGAVTLLRAAADSGWRTVAVTNAVRWSDPLPPELSCGVAQVVSSADVGHVKQEDAFWGEVTRRAEATAARSLVVGDSPEADAAAPARHGFCAVLVGGRGTHQLGDVAGWLPTAGVPPADVIGLAAGQPVLWAGRSVLDVPHLHSLVTATTQFRVRLAPATRSGAVGAVVRRRYRPPALAVPELSSDGCLLWLLPVEDRRNVRLPADLAESLDRLGLSLDSVPNRDRRHLVSLLREAHDQETRQQRRDDIIRFLQRGPIPAQHPECGG